MVTEIWQIDDNGKLSFKTLYTLENAKKALICFFEQILKAELTHTQGNWNTWNYPEDMTGIKQTKRGDFVIFTGDNTATFTRSVEQPSKEAMTYLAKTFESARNSKTVKGARR